MKRLTPFVPLLLLAAVLLSPTAALAGARRGVDIWWGSVFPALLPSFLSVRTAQELGLLRSASRHPKGQLAVAIGFSLVSGAPNGAKLLHALVQEGRLSSKEGETLLPLVNSVSPAFLLSIIASALLKNKALFRPMGTAFYGVILCLTVPRLCRKSKATLCCTREKAASFAAALSAAIESSMLDMLRIGGCILLCCTLLSLIQPMVPSETARALLAACLEVSTGASAMASLSLPLRLRTSLLIGAAAFGGLSLALQSLCCYPELKLSRYLLQKLLLGGLVGLVCYLMFPLFPEVAAAFADRHQVLERSLSLSALLLSSTLSVACMGIFALMIPPGKRR